MYKEEGRHLEPQLDVNIPRSRSKKEVIQWRWCKFFRLSFKKNFIKTSEPTPIKSNKRERGGYDSLPCGLTELSQDVKPSRKKKKKSLSSPLLSGRVRAFNRVGWGRGGGEKGKRQPLYCTRVLARMPALSVIWQTSTQTLGSREGGARRRRRQLVSLQDELP